MDSVLFANLLKLASISRKPAERGQRGNNIFSMSHRKPELRNPDRSRANIGLLLQKCGRKYGFFGLVAVCCVTVALRRRRRRRPSRVETLQLTFARLSD